MLDTNGDGKISEWTEPKEPIDPKKDHRIEFGCYGRCDPSNRWEPVVLGNRRQGHEARAHRARREPAANV
ncbi:MAG: hypothetical protein DMG02_32605 [Acidobacteria bacterium]|nr:MAG: hypothetical protein DMG02_32605 [Acidobacteriota bacterium]